MLQALAVLALFDIASFWLPAYRPLLAPDSTTGSFERTLATADRAARDPARDVLVLGDSRAYDGVLVPVADRAAGGLHFINAAVVGTTPRVWDSFARALDPAGTRFRAIVIPVDTYADDDGAVGSADNDDRYADLHYVALHTAPAQIARLAASFGPIDEKIAAFFDLTLRGPLLREDVQSFANDPPARVAALRAAADDDLAQPHAPATTLDGLRADFATQTLTLREPMDGEPLARLRRQIFHVAAPSPAYATYRREWLGPIVARYRARGVPVIFVRIPARPLAGAPPAEPSGTLAAFARDAGAQLVPQAPYVALERPRYFNDAEHLAVAGARPFSERLGSDVAAAIRDPHFGAVALATSAPAAAAPVKTPEPFVTSRPAGAPTAESISVATPAPVADSSGGAIGATLRGIGATMLLGQPMPLVSYEFAIFFAAVAVLVALLPGEPLRRGLLLLASYYFYARWNTVYLLVLLVLTALDYGVARGLERTRGGGRRALLALGVCANLAFLGFAKYVDFFSGTIALLAGRPADVWALHVLVPIGISFHTFQSISYIVDVSRGKIRAERNVANYALYIAFFPQLLAGPIVRAGRFFAELYARRRPTADACARGLAEIALGVVKKTAIADRFSPIADAYFGSVATHPGAPAAWCAILAFAMQIYFDFSGYTDIALGCARVLGFDFPQNFHRPYLAWSVTEFWRRWHMTLSSWLRDYLYIPLGGNRHGALATYRNLVLTMLLGGLWHGANWTFVVWGGYHGLALAGERALGIGRMRGDAAPRGVRRIAATAATFAVVCVGWIFFRAQSLGDAFAVLRECFAGGAGPLSLDFGEVAIVAVAFAVEIGLEARVFAGKRLLATAVATLLALQLAPYPGASAPFVYFKF